MLLCELSPATSTPDEVETMNLSNERIQRFLGSRPVVVLATVQADGAPLAMPMWFLHDASEIAMITIEGTQKVRNLRRDPRVCVVAEAGGDPGAEGGVRGVSVHGRAEFVSDGSERRALAERFLVKYHPRVEQLWGGRVMPPNRVAFRIVPGRVRTWGLE
jgi:PPOX class probable F420-dependent enzyme